jgi:hypothetical protein
VIVITLFSMCCIYCITYFSSVIMDKSSTYLHLRVLRDISKKLIYNIITATKSFLSCYCSDRSCFPSFFFLVSDEKSLISMSLRFGIVYQSKIIVFFSFFFTPHFFEENTVIIVCIHINRVSFQSK